MASLNPLMLNRALSFNLIIATIYNCVNHLFNLRRKIIMAGKEQKKQKKDLKKPAKTLKEKRAAKKEKKGKM